MLLTMYDYFAILTSFSLKVKISEIVSTCTWTYWVDSF